MLKWDQENIQCDLALGLSETFNDSLTMKDPNFQCSPQRRK